jgi:integrase
VSILPLPRRDRISRLVARALERHFAGPAYIDRDLVFANALGGAIHPDRLTEWFARHRKAASIPTGSLHTLRHTAATLALTNGVPVHIVAARLGDRPEQILATYAHLLPQSDELAAEQVAAALRVGLHKRALDNSTGMSGRGARRRRRPPARRARGRLAAVLPTCSACRP